MGKIFNHTHFTFNTTGSVHSFGKPFQLFLDKNGNIVNKHDIEYGIYNKIIDIDFKKVFIIKKHYIGLGDIIDWITTITKIKNFIIFITNGNCGCEQRRIKFNKWFKFYWFSFKFRKIYADDLRIIPEYSKLIKNAKPLPEPKIIEEQQNTIHATNNQKQVSPSQIPLSPDKIKKSCGCGAKR